MKAAIDNLLDVMMADLLERADEKEKPIILAPMNMKRLKDALHNAITIVQKHLDDEDKAIPREYATRFNAMVEPMIETVEQFIAET